MTLSFPSKYALKFVGHSQFVMELGDQKKGVASPIYIYIRYGQHKMVQAGKKGQLFLIKEGRQFLPEQTIPPKGELALMTP